MAITKVPAVDVAKELGEILATVDGLRVYWYTPDKFRPPGVVIGMPDIDYADLSSGFCRARFEYPLTIVVARNADREAQEALSRWTNAVAMALGDAEPPTLFSVEPLDARPVTTTVNGQDLPAYSMRVAVRA